MLSPLLGEDIQGEEAIRMQEKNDTIANHNDNRDSGQADEKTSNQIWSDIINFRSHFNKTDCITALFFGLGNI